MPEVQLLGLPDEDAVHLGRHDVADHHARLVIALRREGRLQFKVGAEVVLDGALVATRDEDQGVNPRGDGLLGDVLDDRLVDHRQQLLWHGDGGWEEARAEAGDRKDGLAKSTHAITRQGRFSGG